MNASTPTLQSTYQLLTGPGPAAIAVVRIRGSAVDEFLTRHIRTRRPITPEFWIAGRVRRAELTAADGSALDDILVSVHSPPPDWDLRLHLHGSPWLVGRFTELLAQLGFVERREEVTTLWSTTDTIDAEGYALLPRMVTVRGARWLLRQMSLLRETLAPLARADAHESERALCRAIAARARDLDWFARPLRVALIGPPNVGKSTLANALADQPVSLVSPQPGTTRDWIEIPGEARGFPTIWLDTAGLRDGTDELEAHGIALTERIIAQADATLVVLDVTSAAEPDRARFLRDYPRVQPACVALNKCDLVSAADELEQALPPAWQERAVVVSAAERTGLEPLVDSLIAGVGRDEHELEQPAAFTSRQAAHLEAASHASDRERFQNCISCCLCEPTQP